jgi:hypothetical protein
MRSKSRKPNASFNYRSNQFIALGVASSISLIAGCGGGDAVAPSGSSTPIISSVLTPKAELIRPAAGNTTAPTLALKTESGGSLTARQTASGSQVSVVVGNVDYVTLFNASGVPLETVNTTTGEKVKFEFIAGRVHITRYSASNALISALAVFQQGSDIIVADLVGLPALDGQITGAVTGSNPASFAIIAEETAGLTNLRKAPADVLALANGLFPAVTSSSNPQEKAVGGIDVKNVAKYALIGATVGSVLPGGGTAVGALVGTALGIVGQVISSNSARVDVLTGCIQDLDACKSKSLDIGDSAGMALFGGLAAKDSESDLLQTTLTQVKSKWDGLKGGVNRVFDATKDVLSSLRTNTDFSGAPNVAIITSNVSGQLVDTSNRTVTLSGTVDPQGNINMSGNVAGQTAKVELALTTSGSLPKLGDTQTSPANLQGTMTGPLGTGAVTGKSQAVGECNSVQQSGGKGTFSYVHRLGTGNGTSSFSYDAYTIPDAFTVTYGSGAKYSTAGLVSGSGGSSLALGGISTVFVTVSAPTSGTNWQYSLSCPA